MGKLYGQRPSYYFDLDDKYMDLAIDYACAVGYWSDENDKYDESKQTAQNEAGSIGQVLEQYRQEMQDRR